MKRFQEIVYALAFVAWELVVALFKPGKHDPDLEFFRTQNIWLLSLYACLEMCWLPFQGAWWGFVDACKHDVPLALRDYALFVTTRYHTRMDAKNAPPDPPKEAA